MDNEFFDVRSQGEHKLAALFDILFGPNRKVVGYAIREKAPGKRWDAKEYLKNPQFANLMKWREKPKDLRIVLFWTDRKNEDGFVPFPFKMDAKGAAEFVSRWLAEADYGTPPSHDGSNEKGWRVYCEDWGHVDGDWSAFLAVSPYWALYGK